jgi:hypothetical protein
MAEKKIGEKTFKVEPMLATQAIRLQARLLKVVGPALDKLPTIFAGRKKGDEAASNGAAIAAFTDIFTRADPDAIMELIKDVCEVAMVKRPSGAYDPVSFDGDFTGNLGEIIPVAVFVLQEQFGDFFTAALANGKAASKGAH